MFTINTIIITARLKKSSVLVLGHYTFIRDKYYYCLWSFTLILVVLSYRYTFLRRKHFI